MSSTGVWRRRAGRVVVAALVAGAALAPAGAARASGMVVTAGLVAVADDGQCSLREAVANAEADSQVHDDCPAGAGADVIVLPAGTYRVDDQMRTSPEGNSAFHITTPVSLVGAGSQARAGAEPTVLVAGPVRAGPSRRHFQVHASGVLELQDLRLQGGAADPDAGQDGGGGAVRNDGSTSLSGVALVDNAAGYGGAISNVPDAQLLVEDSDFVDNTGYGGALWNAGTATVRGTTFTGGRGHGAVAANRGWLEIDSSHLVGNGVHEESAGSLLNVQRGHLLLSRSTVHANDAGGLANWGSTATVVQSTFSHNVGGVVGGITSLPTPPDCGGLGGCAPASQALLSVHDSTISGNAATTPGKPSGVSAAGVDALGDVDLQRVTVVHNPATPYQAQLRAGGRVFVANTVVAGPGGGGPGCEQVAASGASGPGSPVWSGSAVVDEDGTCGPAATQVASVLLQPLSLNGGPTRTHLPHPASPLVDAGDPAFCPASRANASSTDQRGPGFPRTVGASCDVGAVEAGSQELLALLVRDVEQVRVQGAGAEGVRTGLLKKLAAASAAVEDARHEAARGQLGAFTREVSAHRGRRLDAADTDRLERGAQVVAGLLPDDRAGERG